VPGPQDPPSSHLSCSTQCEVREAGAELSPVSCLSIDPGGFEHPKLSAHPGGGISTCSSPERVIQGGWVGQKVPAPQKRHTLGAGIYLWMAR